MILSGSFAGDKDKRVPTDAELDIEVGPMFAWDADHAGIGQSHVGRLRIVHRPGRRPSYPQE